MSVIRGDAAFIHGAMTHTLAAPVRFEAYGDLRRRYTRESLDRAVIDKTTVGSGVKEVVAHIHYDDDPAGLVAMLRDAARNGTTLEYFPSVAAGSSFDFTLSPEMADVIEILADRQFGGFSFRWEVTVRLRTSDDLSGLIEST